MWDFPVVFLRCRRKLGMRENTENTCDQVSEGKLGVQMVVKYCNTWLNVEVPFLVLVSILHSVDSTFKLFKFATNILVKGPPSNTNWKCLKSLLFLISNNNKKLFNQTGFLSGQNFSLAWQMTCL